MGSDMFFSLVAVCLVFYHLSIIHKLLSWNEYQFYVFSDYSDIHSVRLKKGLLLCTDESSLVFCETVIVMRCMDGLGSILFFLLDM